MANAASGKGNPAHKRMSNDKLKSRRQQSWKRGQERHERNRAENAARAARNEEIRSQGSYERRLSGAVATGNWDAWLTPHEVKQHQRKVRRDLLRAQGKIPSNSLQYAKKHGLFTTTQEGA